MMHLITALNQMISQSPSYSKTSRHFMIQSGILSESKPLHTGGHLLTAKEKKILVTLVDKKLSNREIPFDGELILKYKFDSNAELTDGSIQIYNS